MAWRRAFVHVLAVAALASAAGVRAQSPARVAWLSAADLASPEAAEKAVDAARAGGAGVLIVPAGGPPEALEALPGARALGKKAGLRVLAAVPVFFGPEGVVPAPDAPPETLSVDRSGESSAPRALDPGSPAARTVARDRVTRLLQRTDVDGIVLTGLGYTGPDAGFSEGDLAQFRMVVEPGLTREQKDALALLPGRDAWTRMFPARWARWRRDNVTGFLQGIFRAAKSARPDAAVVVAVKVGGPYTSWGASDAFARRSQDAPDWKRQGITDALLLSWDGGTPAEFDAWVNALRAAPGAAAVWTHGAP